MQVFEHGAAANDTQYLSARHRTLPIPESVTPIANYPTKLRIFQTLASRYWQVRCYLRGKTYTQSLKTTNKLAAISQAKQFFHIKTAELYGEHVVVREDRPVIFNDLVTATLAQQQARVERGELTALSLAILRSRLSKNIPIQSTATAGDILSSQALIKSEDFTSRVIMLHIEQVS